MTTPSFSLHRRALVLLGSAAVVSGAQAAPLRITLATATAGGGFPAYGLAFCEAVNAADPGLVVTPQASGGSAENVTLLSRGAVDLALVQGAYAYPTLGRPGGATILSPMYTTPGLFVARADTPARTVSDLKGRVIVLGTHHSGLTVMGRAVLTASGLDPDRDVRTVLLDHAGDGPPMIIDRRATALWGGGIGWPGFLAVARDPDGASFIAPSDDAIARLAQADISLRKLTVPAGAFPGQDAPITTIGSWSFILARPGFDPETANRLVRALARAISDRGLDHPQASESTPQRLKDLVPSSWLNLGTAKFLEGS